MSESHESGMIWWPGSRERGNGAEENAVAGETRAEWSGRDRGWILVRRSLWQVSF